MTRNPTIPKQRRLRIGIAAAAGVGLLGLLGVTALAASDDPSETPPLTAGADGTFEARVVDVFAASASLHLDVVEVLSGEEAQRAAVEDGEIPAGEELPNDVYVRDPADVDRRVTVHPDATVEVIACETESPCEPTEVALADFLQQRVRPFNGEHAVWSVTVQDGVLTALAEIYLP